MYVSYTRAHAQWTLGAEPEVVEEGAKVSGIISCGYGIKPFPCHCRSANFFLREPREGLLCSPCHCCAVLKNIYFRHWSELLLQFIDLAVSLNDFLGCCLCYTFKPVLSNHIHYVVYRKQFRHSGIYPPAPSLKPISSACVNEAYDLTSVKLCKFLIHTIPFPLKHIHDTHMNAWYRMLTVTYLDTHTHYPSPDQYNVVCAKLVEVYPTLADDQKPGWVSRITWCIHYLPNPCLLSYI